MGELDPHENDFMKPCKKNNPLNRYLLGYGEISDKMIGLQIFLDMWRCKQMNAAKEMGIPSANVKYTAMVR